MDNYQSGQSTVAASAAEYVFPVTGGQHTIITDEAMGFGFITFAAYDGNVCTTADIVAPPPKSDDTTNPDEDNDDEGEDDGGFWGFFGFGGGNEDGEDDEEVDEEEAGGFSLPWSQGASTVKYSAAASMAAFLFGNSM